MYMGVLFEGHISENVVRMIFMDELVIHFQYKKCIKIFYF